VPDDAAVVDDGFVDDMIDDETLDATDTDTQVVDEAIGQEPGSETPQDGTPSDEPAKTPQPRDEQGQYASPAEDADKAPPAALADQPEATPEETAQEFSEFSYRAYGQDYAVPGSKVGEDGVFVPTESVRDLSYLLGQARGAAQREAELRSQIADVRREGGVEIATAKTLIGEFSGFRELLKSDPAQAQDWLDNLDHSWDLWLARAENEALRAGKDAASEQLDSIQTERDSAQLSQQMGGALQDYVQQLAHDERYAGIDANAMYERLGTVLLDRVFYQAREDRPEDGITVGQIVFDRNVVDQEFEYHRQLTQRVSSETAAAVKGNIAATSASGAPPAVAAGGGEAPSAVKEIPKFDNKKDANAWLDSLAKQTYSQ